MNQRINTQMIDLGRAVDLQSISEVLMSSNRVTTGGGTNSPLNNTGDNGDNMPYKFKIGDKVEHEAGTESAYTGEVVMLNPDGKKTGITRIMRDDRRIDPGHTGWDVLTRNLTLVAPAVVPKTVDTVDTVDFDSVILPEDKKKQIINAISQIDNHDLIFNKWGFSEVFEKGTAISLLFYGPPGTGKTLMGQAIADKFGYKLQIVSTAEIETPEPGGAERNLKKYFAEAQKGKTVLLFDECDSLITDRQHVGMILAAQINALLTELEHFTGIAIFTTNRLGSLDPAFDRRLSLKLEFPMPDAKHRALIWKRMFPKKAPLDKNIRWEDLATIEIAGGHIKNVVLKAARMAAAEGHTKITDDVLWECLEKEVESLEDYKDALENNGQFYGTLLPHAGAGYKKAKAMQRVKGKTQIG